MDSIGKPNSYRRSSGDNTGEDIHESPHGGCCNSYQGIIEKAATSSGEGSHQAVRECLLPVASIQSNEALEKAEKKRKIDKAYRERCKVKKLQMKQDFVTLLEENNNLKTQKETLREKNAFLTQKLQSQTQELNEHKIRLHNLKFENEKQNALLYILSNHLVNPDICHENQRLKDENDQLREIFKLSDETIKLLEENGKLHHENMLLKVQIDALCGMIVDENSKNSGHK